MLMAILLQAVYVAISYHQVQQNVLHQLQLRTIITLQNHWDWTKQENLMSKYLTFRITGHMGRDWSCWVRSSSERLLLTLRKHRWDQLSLETDKRFFSTRLWRVCEQRLHLFFYIQKQQERKLLCRDLTHLRRFNWWSHDCCCWMN